MVEVIKDKVDFFILFLDLLIQKKNLIGEGVFKGFFNVECYLEQRIL